MRLPFFRSGPRPCIPWIVSLALCILTASPALAQSPSGQGAAISLTVNPDEQIGPVDPMWAYFGYDEATTDSGRLIFPTSIPTFPNERSLPACY